MRTLAGAALQGRYDDPRLIEFEGCVNHEIAIHVEGAEVLFVDALDLLRVVSDVVLGSVYGPSPTDRQPTDPAALAALQHRQRGREDGSWGCACGWEQDKPHAAHVADMAREALAGAP